MHRSRGGGRCTLISIFCTRRMRTLRSSCKLYQIKNNEKSVQLSREFVLCALCIIQVLICSINPV